MSKITIYGAPGAGTSHLRWLLLCCTNWLDTLLIDPIDFFSMEVYPKQRSWHNWLKYEKKYKTFLHSQSTPSIEIPTGGVYHGLFPDINDVSGESQDFNVFCLGTSKILKKYAMINSYLDGADLLQLSNYTTQWEEQIKIKNINNKIIWHYNWFLDHNILVKRLNEICNTTHLKKPDTKFIKTINQQWLDCWDNAHKDFIKFFKNPIK